MTRRRIVEVRDIFVWPPKFSGREPRRPISATIDRVSAKGGLTIAAFTEGLEIRAFPPPRLDAADSVDGGQLWNA